MKKEEIVFVVGVLRKTVRERRKMNIKDAKEIVEKLSLCDCLNIDEIAEEVDVFIEQKINYFLRKNNKQKIDEYLKIRKRNKTFFEFFLEHKDSFSLKVQ